MCVCLCGVPTIYKCRYLLFNVCSFTATFTDGYHHHICYSTKQNKIQFSYTILCVCTLTIWLHIIVAKQAVSRPRLPGMSQIFIVYKICLSTNKLLVILSDLLICYVHTYNWLHSWMEYGVKMGRNNMGKKKTLLFFAKVYSMVNINKSYSKFIWRLVN